MFIKRALKFFTLGLIVFSLATVAFAYAASNTVPPGKYGDGSGAITGYAVSNVVYTQDTGNPINVTSVAFTLDAAATTVEVRLISGGTLFACTGGPTNWSCAISGVTVTATNVLEVIAAQ